MIVLPGFFPEYFIPCKVRYKSYAREYPEIMNFYLKTIINDRPKDI